ncbi:MAG TPA: metal ABC transporter permease, partial [Planctomycetota bacterium]|nr:metal ABC transporter permease [Planctomycetota bacterium]
MSARRSLLAPIVALALIGAASTPLDASQFTGGLEVTWDSIREDSQAFFLRLIFGGVDSNENGRIDPAERAIGDVFRTATLGSCLVGATCGLLGAFVILRRMALFGDMIGHAVLPGVVIGFAIAGTKSTPALLAGALGAGLLAAATTSLISRFTRIKEDAALGISLSVYYALGTWLLIWVTNEPTLSVEASGLDAYLFGNPAVIGNADLASLATAGAIVLAAVVLAWKELLVTTFDPSFASSIGIPRRAVDSVLLVLLTIVIVVSIKILGVVLVAAMLAIPAAASVLLSDRLERVAILSAAIGAISGLLGQYASV